MLIGHAGGLTTKIHLSCEQGQKVLSLVVSAGQRGDSPQFQTVPGRHQRPAPAVPAHGPIGRTIPEPADQLQHRKDRDGRGGARRGEAAALPGSARTTTARHAVDCGIKRLKRHRVIRYDKLAVRYETILHIAVIDDWLLTSV